MKTVRHDRGGDAEERGSTGPKERRWTPKASIGRHVHEASRTGDPQGGTEGPWGNQARALVVHLLLGCDTNVWN